MRVPPEYQGREQSLIKHRVLEEYLRAWAHKLGSTSRFKPVRLFYVDCFAGPWQAHDVNLSDTSVAIGLEALEEAARSWSASGNIKLNALFVEKDAGAFQKLEEFVGGRGGRVQSKAYHGEFEDHVAVIDEEIGDGSAFLFIDPTGWKGVAMDFIAPLARPKHRDVLINVMFNDINRFKDDPRNFLREQMKRFFGLDDAQMPAGLSEEQLISLYRSQLSSRCGLQYVADLAIPHPTQERTWFRLVVGGHHHAVLDLFRTVEKKICGAEAGEIRAEAKQRGQEQLSLQIKEEDQGFERRHSDDLQAARATILGRPGGTRERFLKLWTLLLSEFHITRRDVVGIVEDLCAEGALRVRGVASKGKSIRDTAEIEWI